MAKSKELALDIKGLEKTYPTGVRALKGVDLEIASGQVFGLLGPNGAGKSTLIHSITGLVIPTAGSAKIFDTDAVEEYQKARMHIGLSPQDINLDWFLTVEQILDYHGGYFGMLKPERQARIDELLDAFSLTEKKKSRAMMLSGGMKRRMVIARALMHHPKLVVLDEPTAGVDVELRRDLWSYVRKINKEKGTTILLTTHYIEEAEALCNQIALINGGKIINQGTVAELKKAYNVRTLEDVYLKMTGAKGEGQ